MFVGCDVSAGFTADGATRIVDELLRSSVQAGFRQVGLGLPTLSPESVAVRFGDHTGLVILTHPSSPCRGSVAGWRQAKVPLNPGSPGSILGFDPGLGLAIGQVDTGDLV